MTFNPQYSIWSEEDFSTTGGAELLHPTEFNIVGGVTTLLPIVFNEGTHTFDAPWDPVSGWTVQNSMDSESLITGDFAIYDFENGRHGNIGNNFQTAYYTSGDGSSVVYAMPDGIIDEKITVELRVRALGGAMSGSTFSGEFFRHGVYIGDTGNYAFVEVLPEGLHVDGFDGGVVPGDYFNKLRKIRIVKDSYNLTLMTDDGSHTFFASGFVNHNLHQTGAYVCIGAFPETGGDIFQGTNRFHELSLSKDAFTGMTLWDDVKIADGQAVTRLPSDYIPPYPTGLKQINSAPWYPNSSLSQYLAAYVKVIPISGGYTTLTFEHLVPSGDQGNGQWEASPYVNQTTIQLDKDTTYSFDLTNVNLYAPPFQNALRFVIQSESLGGAAPQVDEITFVGRNPELSVDVVPNWKLSSMGKDIYFIVDRPKHESNIVPAHYNDEFYIEN
jgi:hypothetical protein